MKKLLFLLLLPIFCFGQVSNGTETEFEALKTTSSQTVTNGTHVATMGTDGTIGKSLLKDLPVDLSPLPLNYTITDTKLGSHLTGIDNKLGAIVATTAGVTTRVWFTADPTTITAGTFYLTNATNKGTVASAIQNVVNNDNIKTYFAQDLIGNPFATATIFPIGVYAGNLSASTSPNSAQQRWTVELYKCDNNGTPISSGISGAPVGDLGVTVITILDSGLLTLVDGNVTNVQVSGNLASPLSMAIGERVRYHVSAEKVGTAGANITQSVYYGTSYNSYLDVPVTLNTSGVQNLSTVVGATTTDALNNLNTLKANDSDVVHKTGSIAETVTGVKTLSDKLILGESSGTQDLIDLPGLNKLTYDDVGGLLYDFNIDPNNSNSLFLKNNEGVAYQAFYFGDGSANTNVFGISNSLDSGAIWHSGLSVNGNSNVGIKNNNPRVALDIIGDTRSSGVINSNTGFSVSQNIWSLTYTSPDLGVTLPQGYTSDGVYHYQFGTSRIAKYDYAYGTLIANNTSPFTGISGGVDHIGDSCYLNGLLYVPMYNGTAAPTTITAQKIAVFNPVTLALITTYDISAQNPIGADAIATDGTILYVFEYYSTGNRILKYSLTGTYLGSITIATPLPFIQGASYYKGVFYISDQENLYTISLDGSTTTLIMEAPNAPTLHRAEGLEIVNGELRWVVANVAGSNFNTYFYNPTIGTTKKFNADVNGDVTATSVKFPSTQVSNSDVNTLDDYEEGIFTPRIDGLTVAGAGTYSIQSGYYTKIGRLVSVQINLAWTAHTGTGDMIVKGLPFQISNAIAQASIGGNTLTLSANNYISAFSSVGSTDVNLRQTPTGTISSATIPIDTSATININLIYTTN